MWMDIKFIDIWLHSWMFHKLDVIGSYLKTNRSDIIRNYFLTALQFLWSSVQYKEKFSIINLSECKAIVHISWLQNSQSESSGAKEDIFGIFTNCQFSRICIVLAPKTLLHVLITALLTYLKAPLSKSRWNSETSAIKVLDGNGVFKIRTGWKFNRPS